ncbi:MAG: hypothetical protein OHK0039_16630 [Bacteroidia bacterium]
MGQVQVASLQAFQGSRVLARGGRNYATTGDELICTSPEGDSVYWRKTLRGDLAAEGGYLGTPPIACGPYIVIGATDGHIYVFDAQTGDKQQEYDCGAPIRFAPVAEGGRLYVTTLAGRLLCLDTGDAALTGWPVWGGDAARSNLPRP